MALARLELKTVQRSRGRSITASAAYRSGCRIEDHRTGMTFDYTRRSGVVSTTLFGPAGRLDERLRSSIWNAAELAERRKDAVVGRELQVALPSELTPDQRADLTADFAAQLARDETVIVDASIHEPDHRGDARNHHAHLLFSARVAHVDGDNTVTFLEKTKVWDHKISGGERLTGWRLIFEKVTNEHLRRAGLTTRIDMRSNHDRGLTAPATHDGPIVTRWKREAAVVAQRLATTRSRLDRLTTAHRLGVSWGIVASLTKSVIKVMPVLPTHRVADVETAIGRDPHRTRG